MRWDRKLGPLTWSPEKDLEDKKPGTNMKALTMQQIAEMASGLISCLKFTWEIPPDSGGGMAVLDTLCWMGVEEREEGTITEFIPENLRHQHKIKTRALKRVILFSF